ncbi:hypothetical protein EHP00_992 [Ecytonucleospora hepatopenaei]|uniref:Uncharacterized protein n=1 Tax=Ecytonucleospora hepatopenaei TaxID=646526 RepID=A0A1W0E699_9MICR|nr:hypothetical protein EHP00_992 [Ecytonucleospora hepatopenaei]
MYCLKYIVIFNLCFESPMNAQTNPHEILMVGLNKNKNTDKLIERIIENYENKNNGGRIGNEAYINEMWFNNSNTEKSNLTNENDILPNRNISCSLSEEEKSCNYKKISCITMCVLSFCLGLLRSSFCWHQEINVDENLIGKAAQFQVFDLAFTSGAFLIECMNFFITPSFYFSYTLAICGICVISLLLGLWSCGLVTVLFCRFMLGMFVCLLDTHAVAYFSLLFKLKSRKATILFKLLKDAGMCIGLSITYFFDFKGYLIIFTFSFICSFMFLCQICIDLKNQYKKETQPNAVGNKVYGLIIVFAFFFILQALFGANLLLGFDEIITPKIYILYFFLFNMLDIIVLATKYYFFNYHLKVWIIYFCGIMMVVIGHCLLEMKFLQKLALFLLFCTYNLFIENLPEIGLGGLLRNDAEKLRIVMTKGIVLLSDIISRIYSIISNKEELKTVTPFIIIGVVILHCLFHFINRNRQTLS